MERTTENTGIRKDLERVIGQAFTHGYSVGYKNGRIDFGGIAVATWLIGIVMGIVIGVGMMGASS